MRIVLEGATWENLVLPATRADQAITALPDGFLVAGSVGTIVRVRRVDPTAIPCEPSPAANGLVLAAHGTADGRVEATFVLDASGRADLAVIDVFGRRVTTLARGDFPAHAPITRTWNGRTASGRPAASGVYFVRLASGGDTRAVKVVITR